VEDNMGDMADFINECSDNAYEDGYLSEPEDGSGPARYYKVCKCCKKSGLEWGVYKGKYRLGTYNLSGKFAVHVCPVNPLKEA